MGKIQLSFGIRSKIPFPRVLEEGIKLGEGVGRVVCNGRCTVSLGGLLEREVGRKEKEKEKRSLTNR